MNTQSLDSPVDTVLNAIPDAFHRAVSRALTTAFPDAIVQSVAPVHGGLSGSLVFRVDLREQTHEQTHEQTREQTHEQTREQTREESRVQSTAPSPAPFHEHTVLLRIIQNVSAMNDPARQFACMQIAAAHGIAPEVYYTDIASGVSISAFVKTSLAPPTPRDMAQVGTLLRQLHSCPPFPAFHSCIELIRGGLAQLHQVGAVLPQLSRTVLAEFEVVAGILEPHIVLAPSHNDLNPGNVLRDGERQWLVDWESACMNDPLFDVACTIQWFLLDAEREATLLASYFGHTPGDMELAKLALMKQVMFCYYMLVFQLISLGPDGLGDLDAVDISALPTFAEFIGGVSRGEHTLQDPMVRRRLSLVIAKQAQTFVQQPEFVHAKRALS